MILEIDQVVNNVERCTDSSLNYGRNVNDIIEWWLYSLIFKKRTEKEFTWNTLTIKLPVHPTYASPIFWKYYALPF